MNSRHRNAWPVILAGAAQLGWATGPTPRHNPDSSGRGTGHGTL
jgi:hypothetical protein